MMRLAREHKNFGLQVTGSGSYTYTYIFSMQKNRGVCGEKLIGQKRELVSVRGCYCK